MIQVGDRLHGHCGGYFGRDHYTCGTVEAIGPDWIVLRYQDYGQPAVGMTSGKDVLIRMEEYRENDPAHRCPFYGAGAYEQCSFWQDPDD